MTVAKPIAAATLAIALVATPSAMGQAGSEYLPTLPKAGHNSSSGGSGSSSSTSSGFTTSTGAPTVSGGTRPEPRLPHSHRRSPLPKVKIVSASPDTGSGGGLLPIVLLGAVGAMILFGGLGLRRWQSRRLVYRAERHRQAGMPGTQ